ncbi:MAG: lysophospholipid acyltransferase family protein [Oligoflexia bacterium]|nr:lysophospholipid acyltransferase family protein [Oligoflexia bacterium]
MLLNALKAAFSVLFLALTLLPLSALQMASVVVYPFSRPAFRALNRWCAGTWWGFCDRILRKACGTELILSGDPVPPRENSLVFANHQGAADILLLLSLAAGAGRLSHLKWFVKDPLKYVPFIGWGMLFLDCVFLRRDWAADRQRIEGAFARLLRHRDPFWLITFSEGTRLTPEKLRRNQAYALRKGLEPFRNVLMPRPKGFAAAVEGLRPRLDAVYDITLGYEGRVPGIGDLLLGRVSRVHLHLVRHPIEQLPRGEAELAQWLIKRFVAKDALLDSFKRTGRFA